MADVVFILIVVAFFALCVAYVRGCERLIAAADDAPENVSDDVSEVAA